MSCNETNKSLLRITTTENNEVILINKKGEIVSKIDLCNIVKNCETITTLSYDIPTNKITYINEEGSIISVNVCDMIDTCPSKIPPFCVTNLPAIGSPGVLPSPTVVTYGCEGNTTVTTIIRRCFDNENTDCVDLVVATPIDLSFLCGLNALRVQVVTTVTNACGTYTDIQYLPITIEDGLIVTYCGLGCCKAVINKIVILSDSQLEYVIGGDIPSFTTEHLAKDTGGYIYSIPYGDIMRNIDADATGVAITYSTGITSGYTAVNFGGNITYSIPNYFYDEYITTNGIDVLGTEGSNVSIHVTENINDNINAACAVYTLTVQEIEVTVPPTGVNPDGVVVNVYDLITLPTIATPYNLRFLHNKIINNVSANFTTGVVKIPYSVPVWATAKGYFIVSTTDPASFRTKVLAIVVIKAIEPI